jgi:hypothetical protein
VAGVLAAAMTPVAACQLLAGLAPVDTVEPGGDGGRVPVDAAAAHDAGDADAAVDPCGPSAKFPERPPPSPVPGATPVVVAVRHAFFGAGALPDGLGASLCQSAAFNLDGLDTCHSAEDHGRYGPEGSSCARVEQGGDTCDQVEGRDNATTLLLSSYALLLGDERSWLDDHLEKGEVGVMVELASYNGQPDDDAVEVHVLALTGVEGATPEDKSPTWKPDERWLVDSASCTVFDKFTCLTPRYTGHGHVRGGVVVATLDNARIPIVALASVLAIPTRSVRLTGSLVPTADGRFRIDFGRLAGVVDLGELVAQLGGVEVNGVPACRSSFFAQGCATAKAYADMPAVGQAAGDGGPAACGALSFSMSFSAVPAARGKPVTLPPVEDVCADSGAPACP